MIASGFTIIHVVFVGGEQRGPLLRLQSTLKAADAVPGPAQRSFSPRREPTVTGSVDGFDRGHPLPPPRPSPVVH